MYPPSIERENILARHNEMLQATKRYHQAKKSGESRPIRWPKLSNFFFGQKAEKQTAVLTLAK